MAAAVAARARLSEPVRRVEDALAAWVASTTRLDLVLLMTLLLLVVGPPPTRATSVVHLMAFAGVLYRPLARRPAFWFVLVALWLVAFWPAHWTTADNHKWLVAYWTLAVGLSLTTSRPLELLAVNARLMIGLVFLSATAWKLISPDFPSGGFFHFTLLTDARFSDVAEVVGGLPDGAVSANAAAVDSWDDPTAAVAPVELQDGPRVALVGQVMAVGTILLEGLVAAAFLSPDRWRTARLREPALLAFVLVTYPLAPVVGFGWLLVIMGLSQSRLRRPAGDAVYVLAFLGIFAFKFVDVLWSVARRLLL